MKTLEEEITNLYDECKYLGDFFSKGAITFNDGGYKAKADAYKIVMEYLSNIMTRHNIPIPKE